MAVRYKLLGTLLLSIIVAALTLAVCGGTIYIFILSVSMFIAWFKDPNNGAAGIPAIIAIITFVTAIALAVVTIILGKLTLRLGKLWRQL
jgi:hypothetical protein